MNVRIKRIYDEPSRSDGYRVLVDRLWPRAMTRARAALDRWDKDVAPSTELRRRFNHQPDRMAEFRAAYLAELTENAAAIDALLDAKRRSPKKTLTLLYAARDPDCNHALVLRDAIEEHAR